MKSRVSLSGDCASFLRGSAVYDSHAHLDFAGFGDRLREEVTRARGSGVSSWFVPGYDLEAQPGEAALLALAAEAENRDSIRRGVGLHPWALQLGTMASPGDGERLAISMRSRVNELRAVAIGEVGFDRARPGVASIEAQRRVFGVGLELARENDLPLVIHCVRAEDELRKSLRGHHLPRRAGVVHAFNGSRAFAEWLVGLGFCIGIGPLLPRQLARSQKTNLIDCVQALPLSALVLETDSVGAESPLSGLVRVAEAVAQLRGTELAEVAGTTRASTEALFGAGRATVF